MSRINAFGKTWWGEKWIEALEKIDIDTNRLPRGRTYANNGSVKDIQIKKVEVQAKVKGRLPSPYSVRIKFEPFSKSQKALLLERVRENPILQSKLSLGKLPEELFTILEKSNIQLFPVSWKDIHSSCSCPDWADPCKHLAAVYYLLANEIDKNPFWLFNLRGIQTEDLTGFTKSAQSEKIKVSTPEDHLLPAAKVKVSEIPKVFEPSLKFPVFDIHSLFSIIPDKPLFYSGADFKTILKKAYRDSIHSLEIKEVNEDVPHFFKNTKFHLVFSGKSLENMHIFVSPFSSAEAILPNIKLDPIKIKLPVHDLMEKKISLAVMEGHFFNLTEILDLFVKYPVQTTLQKMDPSARFLSVLSSMAISCIRSHSLLPNFITKNEEEFIIRYAPVFHDPGMKLALKALEDIYPIWMGSSKKNNQLMSASVVKEILTFAIDSIFRKSLSANESYAEDKIQSVFFSEGATYVPEKFDESNTSSTVENWLEYFGTLKETLVPVIRIQTEDVESFTLEALIENKEDSLQSPIRYAELSLVKPAKIFNRPRSYIRTKIARQLTLASEKLPELAECLLSEGKKLPRVNLAVISKILSEHADFFDLIGIRFILPKELQDLLKPTVSVFAKSPKTVSYLNLNTMLEFSWKIAIGDRELSKIEFEKLVKKSEGLIHYKGKYILLNPQDVKKILNRLSTPPRPASPLNVLYSAFTGELNGAAFVSDENLSEFITNLFNTDKTPLPENIVANLRPYQLRGFEWMYSNLKKGLGLCIADDMGLGKTLQVICVLQKLKNDNELKNKALIICPTTLLGNWKKEMERFAPNLRTLIYHGTEKTFEVKDIDVVLTTYSLVRIYAEKFKKKEWTAIILDEAQNIKNPLSEQTKALKTLKGKYKLAMSGTPVENRLTELWSIYDFMNPGYLGDLKSFKEELALPIERFRDKDAIGKLRNATSPFLIRRLKSDKTIISDLPDKIVTDEYCSLTKEQASIYENVVKDILEKIENSAGMQRKGLIFQLMTQLKQVCNHPYHFSKRGNQDITLSGKGEKATELLEKILEQDEKTLIFTQYKEMGELLQSQIFETLKEKAFFFHGTLTRNAREKMIKEFLLENGPKILLISLKAGGTGLNLTNASNVLHYDLWWNPAVENQATDRAYRIGQKQNVQVHRLITLGTFEEKIDAMIKSKKELADLTVSAGETWISELSNKDLRNLFSLQK